MLFTMLTLAKPLPPSHAGSVHNLWSPHMLTMKQALKYLALVKI